MSTTKIFLQGRIAKLEEEKLMLVNEQTQKLAEVDTKVEQYRADLSNGITGLYSSKIEKKKIEIAANQASLDSLGD